MNRRGFARSLTVIACAGAAPAVAAIAVPDAVTHFVQDSRLDSREIMDRVARLKPAHHHLFDRDVTHVWRHGLNDVWRDSQAATAGATRYAEFFVLSTLAREHGYRVAAMDEHDEYVSWLLVCDGTRSDGHRNWRAIRP